MPIPVPPAGSLGTYGAAAHPATIGANLANGYEAVVQTNASGQVAGLVGADGGLIFENSKYFSNWIPANPTLSAVRQMLADVRSGTGRRRLVVVSDSTGTAAGAGTGTGGYTGARPSAWPVKLGTKLAANFRIPCNTDHLWSTHNFSAAGVLVTNFDVRVNGGAALTNWQAANNLGVGNSCFYSVTDTASWTYVPVKAFSRVEAYFPRNTGLGSANFNIDGGANQLMNANVAGSYGKVTFDTTLGTHTINTIKSGAPAFNFAGYITYDPLLVELDIIMQTASAAGVNDFIISTGGYSASAIPGILDADAAIICLTTNDAEGGTVLSTYRSRLVTLIGLWQAAGASVILMTGIPAGTARGLAGEYEAYFDVVRDLSVTLNLPLIDYAKYAGSYQALSALGWMYDTRHGNATLYDDEATFIAAGLGALT